MEKFSNCGQSQWKKAWLIPMKTLSFYITRKFFISVMYVAKSKSHTELRSSLIFFFKLIFFSIKFRNLQWSLLVFSFALKRLIKSRRRSCCSYTLLHTVTNRGRKSSPAWLVSLWSILREKCTNTKFFQVRIFPYSDWIRRFTV